MKNKYVNRKLRKEGWFHITSDYRRSNKELVFNHCCLNYIFSFQIWMWKIIIYFTKMVIHVNNRTIFWWMNRNNVGCISGFNFHHQILKNKYVNRKLKKAGWFHITSDCRRSNKELVFNHCCLNFPLINAIVTRWPRCAQSCGNTIVYVSSIVIIQKAVERAYTCNILR
jgi:hypothetical protein